MRGGFPHCPHNRPPPSPAPASPALVPLTHPTHPLSLPSPEPCIQVPVLPAGRHLPGLWHGAGLHSSSLCKEDGTPGTHSTPCRWAVCGQRAALLGEDAAARWCTGTGPSLHTCVCVCARGCGCVQLWFVADTVLKSRGPFWDRVERCRCQRFAVCWCVCVQVPCCRLHLCTTSSAATQLAWSCCTSPLLPLAAMAAMRRRLAAMRRVWMCTTPLSLTQLRAGQLRAACGSWRLCATTTAHR